MLVQLIVILLQHHIFKTIKLFLLMFRNVQVPAPYEAMLQTSAVSSLNLSQIFWWKALFLLNVAE